MPPINPEDNGKYLTNDGTNAYWSFPPVVSVNTQIDIGSTPVRDKIITVTNSLIGTSSSVIGFQRYTAPTGASLDENELEDIKLLFGTPSTGSVECLVKSDNFISGKFRVTLVIFNPTY